MQQLTEILEKQTIGVNSQELFDSKDYEQSKCDYYNNRIGKLVDYDCSICKNKGDIALLNDNDNIYFKSCKCMDIRRSKRLLKQSGLLDQVEECTFDKFDDTEQFQKAMKTKAKDFLNADGEWFMVCGQVGCGKTHICTAIVGELINKGYPARYMLWRDDVVKLKQVVNDDTEYAKIINPLKTTKVLYIDDLFKGNITEADINIAFEIINYRYNKKDLITILSGEKNINELLDIDQAIASRIKQRSKNFLIEIGTDKDKNYRLK